MLSCTEYQNVQDAGICPGGRYDPVPPRYLSTIIETLSLITQPGAEQPPA